MSRIYLLAGFILFLVLTGAVFFSHMWLPLFVAEKVDQGVSAPDTKRKITITNPKANDVLEGSVSVAGLSKNFAGDITIDIVDSNNTIVGTDHIAITKEMGDWTKIVNVTKSLKSFVGIVRVYPTEEHIKSPITQTIPVTFDIITVPDRLVIYSPLRNQVMKGSTVHIAGKMKGFFEGVLHVRLLDDKNAVIFQDVIHANGDNYKDFSSFSKDVKFGTIISTTLSNGSWQFYDVSAKDGSETVLTTISIRFRE